MAETSRDALISVADTTKMDIATACYLLSKISPGSATPGELITWVCRMRPDLMVAQADRLAELAEQLERVDSTHVRRLYTGPDRGWDGPAGQAFEDRWANDFLTYIGKDGSSGRRADFAETEEKLRTLAQVTDMLQMRVANYIQTYIDGLSWDFVEACKTDGEDEYETNQRDLTSHLLAGAVLTVGASNPIGWSVGALALVVNAVFGFMERSFTDARDSLGAAVAGSAMSVQGITEKLVDFRVIDELPYEAQEDLPYEEYEA